MPIQTTNAFFTVPSTCSVGVGGGVGGIGASDACRKAMPTHTMPIHTTSAFFTVPSTCSEGMGIRASDARRKEEPRHSTPGQAWKELKTKAAQLDQHLQPAALKGQGPLCWLSACSPKGCRAACAGCALAVCARGLSVPAPC